jgi:SSS family solute:Na+ symporter
MPTHSGAFGLLSLLDWIVVATYSVGLIVLGLLMSRRRAGPVDYFLASRATHWPVIGLALLASNMSSTALVGLAGGAYAMGISVYDYEWSAIVILVFFCLFLLPSIIRSQTYTMPEFLERRYDRRVRLHFALLTLFLNIFVDSAGVLYSGSLVCQLLFPGWPLWLIVSVLAGTAGLYTTLGGLRAVIYTEAVQAVVLMAGALMISIGAFSRAGGWHAVMSGVAPAAVSLIRPIGDPGVPWPGLLLGIPLLGFYYWCTNQSIVQRMLSAKNIDQARWGALFAGLLKLPVLFLIVLPGTCALLLFPRLPRPDLVYPNLILRLLPTGLVGLVVAGFVAATMVSMASMLNSASTLITMDVIKQFKPSLTDPQVVRIGRVTTTALFMVAVAWAPQLELFPSLWQYLQAVLAYAVPPVVARRRMSFSDQCGAALDALPLSLRSADSHSVRRGDSGRCQSAQVRAGRGVRRCHHVAIGFQPRRAAAADAGAPLAGLPTAGRGSADADNRAGNRFSLNAPMCVPAPAIQHNPMRGMPALTPPRVCLRWV